MAALPKLSNVPERQDLEIYRGASLNIPFGVVLADGTARDITGFQIDAHIRRTHLGPLVVAFSVLVENAPGGLFSIYLTPTQTAALKAGELAHLAASRYWWDVRVLDGAGLAAFMRYGEVAVWAQATIPTP